MARATQATTQRTVGIRTPQNGIYSMIEGIYTNSRLTAFIFNHGVFKLESSLVLFSLNVLVFGQLSSKAIALTKLQGDYGSTSIDQNFLTPWIYLLEASHLLKLR